MKPVPADGTEAAPLFEAGPGAGATFGLGFGTQTAPEVDFEQWAALGPGLVAVVVEAELGPAGGFGREQSVGPESVHGSGPAAAAEVERGFVAGAEAAQV